MTVTNGTLQLKYDEIVHAGHRLGRHLELDGRSMAYTAKQHPVISAKEWLIQIPVLDQGNLGSCTGNAGTYALSSIYADNLSAVTLPGKTLDKNGDNEPFAIELYSLATIADGFLGSYPPTDEGSSGLGVCRALKRIRTISRYEWATSQRGFASLLQDGGAIIGMPWYEAFFNPDAYGFIDHDPNWMKSDVSGGHEIYVEALETWSETDMGQSVIRGVNSWNTSWGDHGRWRMRLSTYQTLKNQIDVKRLVR